MYIHQNVYSGFFWMKNVVIMDTFKLYFIFMFVYIIQILHND